MLNFKKISNNVQPRLTSGNKPLYILFFVFLFVIASGTQQSYAQTNLVYNGDFELYDSCPTNGSTPGDLQIEHCLGWTAPRKLGTSDYFNICSMSAISGVPQNYFGYQQPYNGNGYCGFYAWAINLTGGSNYREYVQTKLSQPLIAGNNYQISFYVSYYGVNYSVEKIGALFSTNDYNANSFAPIISTPQVVNHNGIITDSLVWTKIEGSFIASGGEQFLTIGYFEDSLTVSDTLNTHNEPLVYYESYYYVDGVELIEKDLNLSNIFSPNGDGINDYFSFEFPFEAISIFNRWGLKVFETTDSDNYWNGKTTSGENASDGTYYYVIKIKGKTHKGFVQLVR